MTLNKTLLLAKIRAFAIHVCLSAVLVGIALYLMLVHWFPAPLFSTDGGGIGLRLLLAVDLVLGPSLTFIVFNPGKARRLMLLDFFVIGVIQFGAYSAGLWSIHLVRVQTLAWHEGAFQSVTAPFYDEQTIAQDDWDRLGERAPYVVRVREPADASEEAGVLAFSLTKGLAPYQLQFLYEPLATAPDGGWTLADLQAAEPATQALARAWLDEHQKVSADEARFYRVEGFYGSAVMVLDRQAVWRGGFEAELPVRPSSSPSPKS